MYSKVMTISPEKAELFLKQNIENNRNINSSTVDQYARDMREGRWQLTSQGITFNGEGKLTDGQHRLSAIIKAGVPVEMYVTFDEPVTATLHDGGKKRTVLNAMQMSGVSKRLCNNQTAAMISLLCYMANATFRPTRVEIVDFINANEEMIAIVNSVSGKGRSSEKISRKASINAALYCAVSCGIDEGKLEDFLYCINTGFAFEEAKSAAVLLRNYILHNHVTSNKDRREMFRVATLAIRDFCCGTKRIRPYSESVEAEYWPMVKPKIEDFFKITHEYKKEK